MASEFEFAGAKVFQSENVPKAQALLQQEQVDLVISDIRMPGGTGLDLLQFLKSRNVQTPPIILITGFADITLEHAFDQGAEALMNKPFKLEDLISMAESLVKSPEERYLQLPVSGEQELDIDFGLSLKDAIDQKFLGIGRGGFCIKLSSTLKHWDSKTKVAFNIRFKDFQLQGVGRMRWWRAPEGSSDIMIGLEFLSLSAASFQSLMTFWKSQRVGPYIPSL